MLARVSACTITCGALLWGSAHPAQANAKQPTYETAFYRSEKLKIEAYVFKPGRRGAVSGSNLQPRRAGRSRTRRAPLCLHRGRCWRAAAM
jgi:hypothetical protein